MKGTDVTPSQMDAARDFVRGQYRGAPPFPTDAEHVAMPVENLVRLVAWYGTLRYEAGQKGIGTLEKPGITGKAPK